MYTPCHKERSKRSSSLNSSSAPAHPRTLIKDLAIGYNQNIVAIVKSFTKPQASQKGSDYHMRLVIADESIDAKDPAISLQIFLPTLEGFPKGLLKMKTVIVIAGLMKTATAEHINYLMRRQGGYSLFQVDKDGPSYLPYYSYNRHSILQNPKNIGHIRDLCEHYIHQIPVGPIAFSQVTPGLVFTAYGYVEEVSYNAYGSMVIRLVDGTGPALCVTVYAPNGSAPPERYTCIRLETVKAKSVQDGVIRGDASDHGQIQWTSEEGSGTARMIRLLLPSTRRLAIKPILDITVKVLARQERREAQEAKKARLSLEAILQSNGPFCLALSKTHPLFKEILTLHRQKVFTLKNADGTVSAALDQKTLERLGGQTKLHIVSEETAYHKNICIHFIYISSSTLPIHLIFNKTPSVSCYLLLPVEIVRELI
ncbi:hypothetical protein NEDG_00156 [Nematocida displodere]|uniref:Uncharacterized protein n=1 Tax=Nematocida displodere TaxID=1805483 RepID=A0A177EJN6_9MICR|nr:hypothetical protein NEDG_00156 [Nematocida displodere]